MGKIFDMVQTLVNNLQPTVNPSSSQSWATYGMHNNYTPAEYVSNKIPSLENISRREISTTCCCSCQMVDEFKWMSAVPSAVRDVLG
jgi:hypothetical protein